MFKLKIEPYPEKNIIWTVQQKPSMSLDIVDDGFYLPPIEFKKFKKIEDKWEKFKERVVKKERKKCWICGKRDSFGEPEEFWEYDDKNSIRTLSEIHYLCNKCARIKNLFRILSWIKEGRLFIVREKDLINHFCKINHCSIQQFKAYTKEAFKLWQKRDKQEWKTSFGKYSKLIKRLLGVKKIGKIKFSIGIPSRNLYFTSFSNLCLRWRCIHLWTKFRNKLVKNLEYKCCYCGAKENLHLHEPCKVDNKKLTFKILKPYLLCADCHYELDSYFGIEVKYGEEEVIFDRRTVTRVVDMIKMELEKRGIKLKKYEKQIQNFAHRLIKKNWDKNYRKIEFDKVYNPLVEDILNHFNGRKIKISFFEAERFAHTLNFLKKAINRKNFGCMIIPTKLNELEEESNFPIIPYKIPLKISKKIFSFSQVFLKK